MTNEDRIRNLKRMYKKYMEQDTSQGKIAAQRVIAQLYHLGVSEEELDDFVEEQT